MSMAFIAFRTTPQCQQHELLCNWVCMSLRYVTCKEEGNFWPQVTKLGKGRTRKQTEASTSQTTGGKTRVVWCCRRSAKAPWGRQLSCWWNQVRGGGGSTCGDMFVSLLLFGPLPLLFFFFSTQNIKSVHQMDTLFPPAHHLPGPLPGKELVSVQQRCCHNNCRKPDMSHLPWEKGGAKVGGGGGGVL